MKIYIPEEFHAELSGVPQVEIDELRMDIVSMYSKGAQPNHVIQSLTDGGWEKEFSEWLAHVLAKHLQAQPIVSDLAKGKTRMQLEIMENVARKALLVQGWTYVIFGILSFFVVKLLLLDTGNPSLGILGYALFFGIVGIGASKLREARW